MVYAYLLSYFVNIYYFLDFSLTNWVQNNTLRVGEQLAEGAVTLLLEQLNLTNFFKTPRCDRNRVPYIPSVQGIHNGKAIDFIKRANFFIILDIFTGKVIFLAACTCMILV